jgi:hypothetical protein
MQIGLVVCTGLGFLLTSLKLPHYGVIANLIGQVFWLYSSYRAWREADQIGIFISTVLITLILIYGVTNYWLFAETFSGSEHKVLLHDRAPLFAWASTALLVLTKETGQDWT